MHFSSEDSFAIVPRDHSFWKIWMLMVVQNGGIPSSFFLGSVNDGDSLYLQCGPAWKIIISIMCTWTFDYCCKMLVTWEELLNLAHFANL